MNVAQRIVKNTGILLIAQIISYGIGFFYTVYTARYLGTEGFGIISLAMAFTGILAVLTDLGLSTLATREVSRNKNLSNRYVYHIMLIKIVLSITTFLIAIISTYFIGYPSNVVNIIYLFTFSTIITAFSQNFNSIFQANENMEYVAIGTILNNFLIFLGTIIAIEKGFNILEFAYVYLLSNLVVLIYCYIIFSLKFSSKKHDNNIELKFAYKLIKKALPISISAVFSVIAYRIDSVILSVLRDNVAVGSYTAAYKLIDISMFIPAVFTMAILPVFSNFYISSMDSLKVTYVKSFRYLFILGLIIAILTTFFANDVIIFLYSTQYLQSIFPLQILIWMVPISFLTYLMGTLLVSINKQQYILKVTSIALLINVFLNFILIPYYSFVGASIATVLTQLIIFILYFYHVSYYKLKISVKTILNPLVGGIIVAIFLYYIHINFLIEIFISIFLYITILFSLKEIPKDDLVLFWSLFKR